MPDSLLRVALVIGALIDGGVAILALFFQNLLGPLLDVPTKDPALTTIAGGEFVVVTLLYVAILRGLDRFRGLLWIVALDQVFAAVLPAIEMARGNVAMTVKTVGPIPFSLALGIIFALGARSAGKSARSVSP
jgi:hypothetical protein